MYNSLVASCAALSMPIDGSGCSRTATCKANFLSLFPLHESSPVSSLDSCALERVDLPRSAVHLDNQSGLNVALY